MELRMRNSTIMFRDGEPSQPPTQDGHVIMNKYIVLPRESHQRLFDLAQQEADSMLSRALAKPPGSITYSDLPDQRRWWQAAPDPWWLIMAWAMALGFLVGRYGI